MQKFSGVLLVACLTTSALGSACGGHSSRTRADSQAAAGIGGSGAGSGTSSGGAATAGGAAGFAAGMGGVMSSAGAPGGGPSGGAAGLTARGGEGGHTEMGGATTGGGAGIPMTGGCLFPTAPQTQCSGSVPRSTFLIGDGCSDEGDLCVVSTLSGDLRFCAVSTSYPQCCNGFWINAAPVDNLDDVPACPEPAPSGPVQCRDGKTTCPAGKALCTGTFDESVQASPVTTCTDLCAAGDCSCFCSPDETRSCSFTPEGSTSANDLCTCWTRQGETYLGCTAFGSNPNNGCERDATLDAECLKEPNAVPNGAAYRCPEQEEFVSPLLTCNQVVGTTDIFCCWAAQI